MGKLAFVFSGQGDQYPGMGKELYDNYPEAKEVFERLEKLRPGTMRQCFFGSEEELKDTANTQPCLYAMEMAAVSVLKTKGVKPEAVAGFSLGEVTAAACAGLFDVETGFELVIKRGQFMKQASEGHDTFMAAIIRLSKEEVTAICQQFEGIYPVNFNCPGQITVSGLTKEKDAFCAAIKEAKGRVIPLKVKGAFHSPLMEPAAKEFLKELCAVAMEEPSIPLYSDLTADVYMKDAKEYLSKQIKSPVQWETLIRNMIQEGYDSFIEIGPGKTLIHMINKIDTTVQLFSVAEIDKILTEGTGC